jgi:hypothetical protein
MAADKENGWWRQIRPNELWERQMKKPALSAGFERSK